MSEIKRIVEEIAGKYKIIGRREELEAIILAKKAGKPILIEGPVGVGKTTLAKAVASFFQQDFIRVDGDERFDEYKLVGYFEPQLVLKVGWSWDAFFPGPLVRAMLNGAILFINEINRLSEGAQNVLIPALDEGLIEIPKLGEVKAKDGFWVIATLNPEEYVGVSPLGEALRDRFIWIKLDYQSEDEEIEIVKIRANVDDELAKLAVSIARATRRHPEIRRGASVRGAIDLATLIKLHEDIDINTIERCAVISLGTKIELTEGTTKSADEIIKEIVRDILAEYDFFRAYKERRGENLAKDFLIKSSPSEIPSEDAYHTLDNSSTPDRILPEKFSSPQHSNDDYASTTEEGSNPRTILLFYPPSDPVLSLFKGMLGYYGTQLISAIREGKDIRNILSRLWRPLNYEAINLLGLEAIKYRNFAALSALAEINPLVIANIIEEYITEFDGEDNIYLLHLFYLTRDFLSTTKKIIFRRIAKYIVMKKALRIVGRRLLKGGTIRKRIPYRPSVDFDLESTIENMLDKYILGIIDKRDIICYERRDKRTSGAIILDVSGSMYGEKNVLASIISAVTVYTLGPYDEYSIIVFSDAPYVIKGIRERKRLESIIEEIFNIRPLGYTNIADALKKALEELKKATIKNKKWAILITDGEYNRGGDPIKWASKFRRLHVIQLGGSNRGTQICKALAKGRGKYIYVDSVEKLYNAVKNLLKYPDK